MDSSEPPQEVAARARERATAKEERRARFMDEDAATPGAFLIAQAI
jgi:hypothetical protein